MENTGDPRAAIVDSLETVTPRRTRKRVSILSVGSRLLVALIIVGAALYFTNMVVSERPEPPQRQARERSFTVAASVPQLGTFSPTVQAFGAVVAGRTIDMRAQVSGQAVEVSPNMVVGGEVAKGELLVRIDSFSYDGAVRDSEAALADSRLQLIVVEEELRLEQVNFDVAEEQLVLAQKDLTRAQSLLASGSVTDKAIEDRELLVSQRQQATAQRLSNLKVQQASIDRQTTAIARAEWVLAQAQRDLENIEIRAPFDGVVTSKSAELDRVISNNEVVAQLYERNSLEVRFTLSDRQYGKLVSAGLVGRAVTAIWDIDPNPLEVSGVIVRAGAEVNAALGGVEVFARLEGAGITSLRPGTFVEIQVSGLSYEDALLLPETAIYENDHFYVVRDRRMARVDAVLLARDGRNVIVRADVSEGDRIITTRVAQAGEGLLVTIEGEEPPQQAGGRGRNGGRGGNRLPPGGG